MANKIIDENPLKAKLGIFIEEQGATSVVSLRKGATDHESLRTTGFGYGKSIIHLPGYCGEDGNNFL